MKPALRLRTAEAARGLMVPPKNKSVWAQVGNYASLGVMLPACTAVGYFWGLWLDHLFGTHYLYLVFLIVGIAAGFVELFRIVSKNSG